MGRDQRDHMQGYDGPQPMGSLIRLVDGCTTRRQHLCKLVGDTRDAPHPAPTCKLLGAQPDASTTHRQPTIGG